MSHLGRNAPTIQQGKLTQSLLRRLRVRGGLRPGLEEIIRPVAIVEDQTRWTDLGAGPVEASGAVTETGGVNTAVIQLFHDVAASGTILRVRQLVLSSSLTSTFIVRVGTVVLGAVFTGHFQDQRFAARQPLGHVRGLAVLGGLAGDELYRFGALANTHVKIDFTNLILPGGFGVHVQATGATAIITASWVWDELEADIS